MGKITEALKKVTDERIARIQKRPEIRYVVRKVENSKIDQHVVAFHDPSSPVGEQYKILRTNMQSLQHTKNYKSFVITSAIDGEGKTITALNLAITMAHDLNNKSILVIDADMRKGRMAKYLGLSSHFGLSELLHGKGESDDIFVNPGVENLTVLLSGKPTRKHSELLNSKRMESLLSSFKARFDYIFIDTPPVMPLTDACILGSMVDGVVLVIQAGRTQRDVVKHAESRLYQARAKVIGYVVTNLEYHLPNYLYRYVHKYDDYYNYHSYVQKDAQKEKAEEVVAAN